MGLSLLTHCQFLLVQPQLAVCEARMGEQAATSSMDKDNKVSTEHFKLYKVFSQLSSQLTAQGTDRSRDSYLLPITPPLLEMLNLMFPELQYLVQETELINSNGH